MRMGRNWIMQCFGIALATAGCAGDASPQQAGGCVLGETQPCTCTSGQLGVLTCVNDGTFYPVCLQCGDAAAVASAGRPAVAGAVPGAASLPSNPWEVPVAGAPAPTPAPTLATPVAAVSTGMEPLRALCAERTNMFRATLGLPPLQRATPDMESCADAGAQQDATGGGAYSSLGQCAGLQGQNTCGQLTPSQLNPATGAPDVGAALTTCLDGMWQEGAPPVPVDSCVADGTGCYQQHARYINMSSPSYRVIACGVYQMGNGQYWINQNFGY